MGVDQLDSALDSTIEVVGTPSRINSGLDAVEIDRGGLIGGRIRTFQLDGKVCSRGAIRERYADKEGTIIS